MDRDRLLMRFEGTVVEIKNTSRRRSNFKDEYAGHTGFIEILYSRSSRYTRVFAVFKETSWPAHNFKTTPGLLIKDKDNILHLTTKHHIYTFKVKQFYINNSK